VNARPDIRIEPLLVAGFRHPDGSALAGSSGIVMAHAVIHPNGVLLFDTGMGIGEPKIENAYRPLVRRLPDLMRAHGIEPDDVDALANSHLHFDHCGQNAAFPGRPIHVQALECEAAQAADYTIPAWLDFADAHYVRHAGEVELSEGLRLIPTPGHTPGHQSLLIDSSEGRIVIAGQAVYSLAEWEGADDPAVSGLPSAWDPELYRTSVDTLRGLEPDTILFGHDDRW
jgi:N-acyl homoserine lactone hydrolase